MSYETVQHKLPAAYEVYNLAEPNLPKWREDFQVSFVQALASEKERSAKPIISQMKRGKYLKYLGPKSRNIQQKNKIDPIL